MNELAELLQQKKQLEETIRKMRHNAMIRGGAKIDAQYYTDGKRTRYYLAIFYRPIIGRPKWQTVFSSNDRQRVIDVIPGIIEDLKILYDSATRE